MNFKTVKQISSVLNRSRIESKVSQLNKENCQGVAQNTLRRPLKSKNDIMNEILKRGNLVGI